MRITVTRLTAAAAGIALSVPLGTGPASAAPAGYTAFYTTTGYTDVPRVVDSQLCDGRITMLAGHFATTDNRPSSGCVVQVSSNISRWVALCRGRAELPPTIRYNLTIRTVPGATLPCSVGPWS